MFIRYYIFLIIYSSLFIRYYIFLISISIIY
nr:MAG TPA: hypothetical protein [Caudoviricetes sp.]